MHSLSNSIRDVAQLVAHYVRDVGVGRSSRLIPTNQRKDEGDKGHIVRHILYQIFKTEELTKRRGLGEQSLTSSCLYEKQPMKKIIVLLLLICSLPFRLPTCMSCTSVIISGKATPDGRPILFKHRDAMSGMRNLPMVFQGERYRYLALVNASDLGQKSAWGGHNEAGFAIINTAAYNLNGPEGIDSNGDGALMKRALEVCATLKDFETLLDTLPKPMDLNSNFGVMDAQGGCAYYETNNYKYVKFDVNDPVVAPRGYLMRTNFGTTGAESLRTGAERYAAITAFMEDAEKRGNIRYDYLLTQIPRNLTHGLTHINLYDWMPDTADEPQMFPFRDFIPRYTSTAVMLFQGVLPGEPAANTLCWTIAGYPLTAVAMPLALLPTGKLPAVQNPTDNNCSWLCNKSLELKNRLFCVSEGNGNDYINLAALINKQNTGLLQQILPIEQVVMVHASEAVATLRTKKKGWEAMEKFYDWLDEYLMSQYGNL